MSGFEEDFRIKYWQTQTKGDTSLCGGWGEGVEQMWVVCEYVTMTMFLHRNKVKQRMENTILNEEENANKGS